MLFKLKNADVTNALEAMKLVCGGGNRLPTLAALKASRIKAALAKAWEAPDQHRLQLCKDHGRLEGSAYVFETPEAQEAFSSGWRELLEAPAEVELETLTEGEVEAGWYRNPNTKEREDQLDVAPDTLGLLAHLGIITPSQNGNTPKGDPFG